MELSFTSARGAPPPADNGIPSSRGVTNVAFQDDAFVVNDHPEEQAETSSDNNHESCKLRFLERKYDEVYQLYKEHGKVIKYIIYGVLLIGYLSMVTAACIINFHRALALFVITVLAIFFFLWDTFMEKYEGKIVKMCSPLRQKLKQQWFWMKWVLCVIFIAAIVFWLCFDTAKQGTNQLISFGGLLMYVLLMFLLSKHPTKVPWRAVFWGIGLQFVFGIIILRTKIGFEAFEWLGKQVQIFLQYTDTGSKFVFGDSYEDHFFVFKVLPIVIFFSTVISLLYYIGFMQWLILKVGWIMQITMGTSPTESMVAAGNIFVGQTESPLLIRPYLPELTKSELHAVMTGGFATIAGSVLGAYISFGVSASHLLSASVMSAPASLAVAKLFWPETKTATVTTDRLKMEKGEGRNLIEAAYHGASSSIPLVANIAANLIAFLALLAFINAALSWLGNMFDYPQLSFELICSYIFMPLSFMMGVDWEDSFLVGRLLGYKTFFNEFVAYEQLSLLISKRKKGEPLYIEGVKQYLSIRSETIATYALCGFANFGSLGIMIGGLASMAPTRKSDIVDCAIRALIAGTVACFMTACIAGILYIPPENHTVICHLFLENVLNSSAVSNTTNIINCCQDLFNRTLVSSMGNLTLGGNYTLSSLTGCCRLMDSPTFNCTMFSS